MNILVPDCLKSSQNAAPPALVVNESTDTVDVSIDPSSCNEADTVVLVTEDDAGINPPLMSSVVTSNPAIDADLNIANPFESIDDDALEVVDGDPPIVAGVLIALAVTDPSIVTPLVIRPPSNKTFEPVI